MTAPAPLGAISLIPASAPLQDPSVAGAFAGITGQLGLWTLRAANLINKFMSGQLPGTGTNDTAMAGNVGEYIVSEILFASRINISLSATPQNLTSIVLPAGDWQVGGNVLFGANGATTTDYRTGISQNSGVFPDASRLVLNTNPSAGDWGTTVPSRRIGSTGVTAFLVIQSTFGAGTPQASGTLWARRMR